MINVSQAVMDEFLSPAQKNLRLKFSDNTTLNNADIYTETMHLEQSICTEEQIRFGAVNSACFKVQIKGTSKRYVGLKVTPDIFTNSGGITLGEFTIVNDELSDNREYRSLTAYDALNGVFEKDLSSWYTNLALPMTLRNFRNSLFSTLGITQEAGALPNDNMVVERTVSTTDAVLTGKKVLEAICEINGRFGAMVYNASQNRSVFRYVEIKKDDSLYPRDDLYPSNTLYPHQGDVLIGDENDILQGGLVYQEYTSLPITRVQIKNTAHDVGATYPSSGTGNAYQIIDNFLMYGKDDAQLTNAAQNFYNEVKHITYIPSKAIMRGRPWQEVGDLVVISIKRTSVSFPILHRVLSGITALKDEYNAKGREYYTYSINSSKRQLEQVRQKTLEIVTTVDELRTTMTERVTTLDGKIETYKSTFQQTAQQIQSTVEAHYNEQTSFQSQITQRANEISLDVQSRTSRASIIATINGAGGSTTKISADNIDITGFVTFTDLSTSGRTTISGDNITTGIISDASGKNHWNLATGEFVNRGEIRSVGGRDSIVLPHGSDHEWSYGDRLIKIKDGNISFGLATDIGASVEIGRYGNIGFGSDVIGIGFYSNAQQLFFHDANLQSCARANLDEFVFNSKTYFIKDAYFGLDGGTIRGTATFFSDVTVGGYSGYRPKLKFDTADIEFIEGDIRIKEGTATHTAVSDNIYVMSSGGSPMRLKFLNGILVYAQQ